MRWRNEKLFKIIQTLNDILNNHNQYSLVHLDIDCELDLNRFQRIHEIESIPPSERLLLEYVQFFNAIFYKR